MRVRTADLDRPLRVVIGEDDVLLREGVARILTDAGMDVVASSGDADQLLRQALAYRPDVLADVQMPPRGQDDGLRAALELRRRQPGTGVLILSHFCEPGYVMGLVGQRPEGVGYLLKERVGDLDVFIDHQPGRRGRQCSGPRSGGPHAGRSAPARWTALAADPPGAGGPCRDGREEVESRGRSEPVHSQASVEKHVTSIFRKLRTAPAESDHRRVHAVLAYLRANHHR
jgi:CheY-like chemotaxis protein